MKRTQEKIKSRQNRRRRIRSVIQGTPARPRLAFFRSNKQIYAQIIDDTAGVTLVGVSSLQEPKTVKGSIARAEKVGALVAEQAKKSGITTVVFDRGGFLYTGSVQVFADAARAGGLQF